MNFYVVLTAVVSFAVGGAVTGGVIQMTTTAQNNCDIAQTDSPRLPSSLFQTKPIPPKFKNW